ncbi:short-chain fatty acyl-CoA regulator family protein [Rhizobium sp. WW_1]|jgi:predicted transcriptional regulator/transcriptional regulator with XRE-family HTH domain|uniref:short-chain fatty acyl-CoA regulator family protein n=1 Tax=Rhizobium sp. WW_1 TaxID=1907375 RepID=UPI000647DF15|nr:short-chain fatty acyl-CoA regulator family protein [Rhizobium sp. WW_1]RKD67806.1 Xre family transcriptional regulator [Rhizobium sp. WW_1]
MKKPFVGVRLKRLREERRLTQQALSDKLGISLSYLNQIENNQRPITVPVLLRLNAAFGVDVQLFSEEDEARLVGELRELFSNPALGETISNSEIREIAVNMPAVGRAMLRLQKQWFQASERAETFAAKLGDDRGTTAAALPAMPYEEVRDYFSSQSNYIPELDEAAEGLAGEFGTPLGSFHIQLQGRLLEKHAVRVETGGDEMQRRFEAATGILRISSRLNAGQRAFQLATQLCFLEHRDLLDRLTKAGRFSSDETRSLARIGLANYFAGALILPYTVFLEAAEALRYDIDLLGEKFGVGFETICHRLSTLQRPTARGVPFFLVRVDRAGNMSKRQSATHFHFSRIGGTCPLWTVYEAFAQPGRICTQLAEMPDGRAYLWIARTVMHQSGGFGGSVKSFAVGLGCNLADAARLVYSKALPLDDPAARTPIGVGCKLCERKDCPQRAFPPAAKELIIDESVSSFAPYSTA